MTASKKYQQKARELAIAIDIAIDAFNSKRTDLSDSQKQKIIESYLAMKEMAINPTPQFRKIKSLEYLVEAALAPFQEDAGYYVDYFWRRITSANLNFQREDKLQKILDRGRITKMIEYDYVVENIVIAQQENRITQPQVAKLNSILTDFESKKRRPT